MATLEELLDIEGVVAAGEFGRDGAWSTSRPGWTSQKRWRR
jgi:roadblock/LC7 domain-containing protein